MVKRQSIPSKNPRAGLRSVYDEGMREASDLSDSYNDGIADLNSPTDTVEVFYSFDSPSAPRAGEHLLSAALTKAVERFEIKQTEKLALEYEFIDERESVGADGYTADEDDYEFVDRVNL